MSHELSRIRALSVEDLPKLAPLAAQFYASSRFLRQFDGDKFNSLWTGLIQAGNGVIFGLEVEDQLVGAIGGMTYPQPYSGDLIAQEFFWFVDPARRGHGIRLYHQFEMWAREKGCAEIHMVHLADLMPAKVGTFYERLGYEKTETLYSKRLDEVAGLRRAG